MSERLRRVIPSKDDTRMVATSVRVPAHLLREVDALAKELDYSRNEVVQFCLEFAIETHREQQRKKMQEPK